MVQAGDVIAQLDPERFELALQSARADHELAEKTLSRVESLKASGTVSQAELDEAVARAKLASLAKNSSHHPFKQCCMHLLQVLACRRLGC